MKSGVRARGHGFLPGTLVLLVIALAGCTGYLRGGTPPGSDGGPGQERKVPPWPTEGGGEADGHLASQDQGAKTDAKGPVKIWRPQPGTTWQWQLSGSLDLTVKAQMFDIDLFDNSATTIAALKAKGSVVLCYFSAGSYEDWRPDAASFPAAALGQMLDGWNERWLDTRSAAVRAIMAKRLDLARSKGCDGVEPDNVDGYQSSTGFPLTAADQISYNTYLAAEAHKRGLSVGLKNDVDQVGQLQPLFDWALNEECLTYNECAGLSAFINAGKAVFHVEYQPASKAGVCPRTKLLKFDTLIKKLDLDAWFEACWS